MASKPQPISAACAAREPVSCVRGVCVWAVSVGEGAPPARAVAPRNAPSRGVIRASHTTCCFGVEVRTFWHSCPTCRLREARPTHPQTPWFSRSLRLLASCFRGVLGETYGPLARGRSLLRALCRYRSGSEDGGGASVPRGREVVWPRCRARAPRAHLLRTLASLPCEVAAATSLPCDVSQK